MERCTEAAAPQISQPIVRRVRNSPLAGPGDYLFGESPLE